MEKRNDNDKLANFYLEVMDLGNDAASLECKLTLDSEQIKRWEQGEAILALVPPSIDAIKWFEHFYSVAQACQRWQAGPRPVSNAFLQALQDMDKTTWEEFINSLFKVDGQKTRWAKKLNISLELLDFLAQVTFRPLLKTYGEEVAKQLPLGDWAHGHCPVCGDQPTMAKLAGSEGYRKLFCGRCETEWRYKRIGCPYCKDENASEASFIALDDHKQYRVYLCDRCKSYLKTVDERVSGEVDLFCEDLATVELDKLAQSEGYQRGDKRQQV
ncbi:formate dehydrogenase accessory protein FdhE [Desulforamulus aeronauticus]|uniref:FdhE protein n=1 Tax=Desulforamulus aeronauticus DSM 10349 TaxID=1121421 RepID=A0A1M6PBR0_9FIRM|nr:formate dehydrogenase accessory protein FdhE [Desulforamulus aeronauticus]SHK05376.1 FdhE protein [Desulforamulus aeronauticus DSM 10349]